MNRGLLIVGLSLAWSAACDSFEGSSPSADDAGDDAGPDGAAADANVAPDAGADSSDGAPERRCKKPTPPNTYCLDFDDGGVPSGQEGQGTFELDDKTFVSPPRSLLLSTPPTDAGTSANLSYIIPGVPSVIDFEQHVLTSAVPTTELGNIAITGTDRYYAAVFVLTGTTLEVYDGTYANGGGAISAVSHQLRTIPTDEWIKLGMHLELTGFPGASASRRLVISVDDVPQPELVGPAGLPDMTPQQTYVHPGISWAGLSPEVPRKVNIDDVFIEWKN